MSIKRIVLTGGPCAGKTSALERITKHFTARGYKVFTVPEVPTMFTQAGMDYLTQNKLFFYQGERSTMEIQLSLEDTFMRLAETIDGPSLVVCDRGTLDISAYLRGPLWDRLLSDLGTSDAELMKRYDAVIHLVSAANGTGEFYNTATNSQRLETADEEGMRIARDLDQRVSTAWAGHADVCQIGLYDDFEEKMSRVVGEVERICGV